MTLHPRRRALRIRLWMVLWLTVVWCLLWSDFAPGTILAGLLVALTVGALLPMPAIEFSGRIHPWNTLVFLARFLWDVLVASWQVAAFALRRKPLPPSAVIAVHLRSHSDLYLTLTGVFTSLVPGSVIVEAHRLTGMLYVHFLGVGDMDGVERARRAVLETEAGIMRAIGSDAELEDAGLTRRRPRGRGRDAVTTSGEVGR